MSAPVAWLYPDDAKTLGEVGQTVVYAERQKFVLMHTPYPEPTPLYAHPPAAPAKVQGDDYWLHTILCKSHSGQACDCKLESEMRAELTRLRAALDAANARADVNERDAASWRQFKADQAAIDAARSKPTRGQIEHLDAWATIRDGAGTT